MKLSSVRDQPTHARLMPIFLDNPGRQRQPTASTKLYLTWIIIYGEIHRSAAVTALERNLVIFLLLALLSVDEHVRLPSQPAAQLPSFQASRKNRFVF